MPADAFGCGHYRMIWPANVLHINGMNVRVFPPTHGTGLQVEVEERSDGKRTLKDVNLPHDTEAIVLQRPAAELHPQLVRMVRAAGIPVIVDMDDDMSSIHPSNDAFYHYRNSTRNGMSWKYAAESCRDATMVTTSTKRLQAVYAKHGRGRVIDNYVPAAYLEFERKHTGHFGWAGSTNSHPDDLQVTGKAIPELMAEGFCFTVVGGKSQVKEVLRLPEQPNYTGVVGPENWARTIALNLEVGMAPLAVSSFNTAKSRLKPIEMMAVGVPWVSSPREEYRRVHRESGCGFLADTPKQWRDQLRELLTNDRLREEQAQAGREYMRSQTYEMNAWRWWEAWQDAIELEKKLR